MPLSTARLERSIPARPDPAAALRREVAALVRAAGASPLLCRDLELAVAEVINNVVLHAYPDGEPGLAHLTAQVDPDAVTVVVADDGIGLAPRHDSPGAGFGLPLVHRLASDVQIRARRPGTEVRLRFLA